jgi:hypothetical protein
MMWLASITENVAVVPLNFTPLVPIKFDPVIVTDVPTGPLVGEKLAIVGAAAVTVNELADVAVPPAAVTDIVPVVAPLGTVAAMWLASITENVAVVPLNFTPVAPVKSVPVIVTLAPTTPLGGEKLAIVGAAAFTVKLLVEVAVPAGVTIAILPVTALAGTVNVALVALATEKAVAATPPTVTEVAPVKFVPVTVTVVPVAPLVGVKLVIVGLADGCCGFCGFVFPVTAPPHPIIAAQANTRTHKAAKLFFTVNSQVGISVARLANRMAFRPWRRARSGIRPHAKLPSACRLRRRFRQG